jgi:hypothetical protein
MITAPFPYLFLWYYSLINLITLPTSNIEKQMLYTIHITDRPMPFTNPLEGLHLVLATCDISRITLH